MQGLEAYGVAMKHFIAIFVVKSFIRAQTRNVFVAISAPWSICERCGRQKVTPWKKPSGMNLTLRLDVKALHLPRIALWSSD